MLIVNIIEEMYMRRKVLVLLLTLSLILSFTPMIAFADTEADGSIPANETVEAEKTEPEEKAEPEEPVQDDVETEEAEEPVDETAAVEEESAEDASQQTVAGQQALNAVANDPESEECEHENTYTYNSWDDEKEPEYEIIDNRFHKKIGSGEKICGEVLSREESDQLEEEEEHNYDENHKCVDCGHSNTCAHGETYTYISWNDEEETKYEIIDNRFHKKIG